MSNLSLIVTSTMKIYNINFLKETPVYSDTGVWDLFSSYFHL